MVATILEKIVAAKRREVAVKQREVPVSALQERIASRPPTLDLAAALGGDEISLIAEVKKASPSRGVLCPDLDPVALARTYAVHGAAAVSVLTEVDHFQGRLEYLPAIRQEVDLPLLRKDFIFDEYQVYESAAYGADAHLLIAAILEPEQLARLLSFSRSLGLDCLVETHNDTEIEKALLAGATIIGINNRDLDTFTVDIETTRRLRPLVPPGHIVVSESGIRNRDDIELMKEWGINAVLVGEALVTAGNLPAMMEELR